MSHQSVYVETIKEVKINFQINCYSISAIFLTEYFENIDIQNLYVHKICHVSELEEKNNKIKSKRSEVCTDFLLSHEIVPDLYGFFCFVFFSMSASKCIEILVKMQVS